MTTELPSALVSPGRSPEIPADSDVYGWLVGSWTLEVRRYAGADTPGLRGELHAAWVLEGRAVQDTWIMPPRSARPGPDDTPQHVRHHAAHPGPALRAWRIAWSNPAGNHYEHQIGRWSGKDIVQLGVRPPGVATRWMFTEITPRSFRWLGDALAADGITWLREAEFVATRVG